MIKRKKKIAIFIDWFLPGYKAGGPITSVANIVSHLKNDFEFYIITSDRDLGDNEPYSGVERNKWVEQNGFQIMYLSPKNQKKSYYRNIFIANNFDFIYFNSLFSLKFTIHPLYLSKKYINRQKIILAPRGMLGQGAINIKPLKKKSFFLFSKLFNLFQGITWHSTNSLENTDIERTFGKETKIKIAENLSLVTKEYLSKNKNKDLLLVFYSRISKKKNLDFALNILSKIDNKKIRFDIIGPIEDKEYWTNCKKTISELPANITVNYIGLIKPEKAITELNKYDFLLLPTRHENFGHAIFEAFIAGCPIIISNNTPWQNLEEKNIGWDIDLQNTKKFINTIKYCANISQEKYNKMSEDAYNFAKKFANNPELVKKTKKLFDDE